MIVRVLAAAAALAVLLPSLVLWGAAALEWWVPFAIALGLWEFASMMFPGPSARAHWALQLLVSAPLYVASVYGQPSDVLAVVGPAIVVLFVACTIWPGASVEVAMDRLARLLLGVAWCLLLTVAIWIARSNHGMAWLFVAFLSTWLGDTGAYLVGKAVGRRKLSPRLSPNKTWEGIAGGLTLSTMGVIGMAMWAVPNLSAGQACVLGPLLYAAGVFGDLAESMLKRSAGVKDSGRLMPGHGGVLDRLDSFMAVAPVLFMWMRGVGA